MIQISIFFLPITSISKKILVSIRTEKGKIKLYEYECLQTIVARVSQIDSYLCGAVVDIVEGWILGQILNFRTL